MSQVQGGRYIRRRDNDTKRFTRVRRLSVKSIVIGPFARHGILHTPRVECLAHLGHEIGPLQSGAF
jgi:hypothetical protein